VNPAHLMAVSHADNILHSWIAGRTIQGERASQSKLTDAAVREMRVRYFQGWSYAALAQTYGVRMNTVWSVTHYHTWKHVE
jgi:DNA-directed RNA polymerase specialized sigma24 family protein